MKKQILFIFAFLFAYTLQAQNVGIGTTTPDASAALDVSSTTQGTLITRMTSAQRKAIANPAMGLLVFDLDKKTIYMWSGKDWMPFLFSTTGANLPTIPMQGDDTENGDAFGVSVDMSGNFAVVGAYGVNVGGNYSQGSAYVFKRYGASWNQMAKLVASDGAANDNFGGNVAISGNFIVVGASNHSVGTNNHQGCAYVFFNKAGTWIQVSQLVANDGAANDYFGGDVAISGNYIVVGVQHQNVGSNAAQGSAYVFGSSGITWTQQDKLLSSDAEAKDEFGNAVAISGDYIVVGASRDDDGSNLNVGSAYVYGRIGTNWVQLTKLTRASSDVNGYFGGDVGINGDYIIVGEPGYSSNVLNGGRASLFYKGSGWNNGGEFKRSFSSNAEGASLGRSVHLSDNYLLVGTKTSTEEGIAYLYKKEGNEWSFQRIIEDEKPASSSFGSSFSSSGFNIILGESGGGGSNFPGEVHFLNVE